MSQRWGQVAGDGSDRDTISRALQLGAVNLAVSVAEAVESLAYATLPLAEGVGPGEVAAVLAELIAVGELLPQIAEQLTAHLEAHAVTAEADVPNTAVAADAVSAVATAEYWLAQVAELACGLRQTFVHARAATVRLTATGPV